MSGMQSLTIDDSMNMARNVPINTGFYITRKIAFISLACIVMAFLAVILGLSLGLTQLSKDSDKNAETGAQTDDYCVETLCKNPNFFDTGKVSQLFYKNIKFQIFKI
jgi:hypothetical protein